MPATASKPLAVRAVSPSRSLPLRPGAFALNPGAHTVPRLTPGDTDHHFSSPSVPFEVLPP